MAKRDLVVGDRRWTPEEIQEFARLLGFSYAYARTYMRRVIEADTKIRQGATWQEQDRIAARLSRRRRGLRAGKNGCNPCRG